MQEQQMLLAELSTHPRHPHVLPGLSLSPLPPSTHPLALNPCACGSKILRCTQNKSKMAFNSLLPKQSNPKSARLSVLQAGLTLTCSP